MANEDIGEINCAWCGNDAPIRKRKDGKVYVMCAGCGQQFMNGPTGQDIILERGDFYGVTRKKETPKRRKTDITPANDLGHFPVSMKAPTNKTVYFDELTPVPQPKQNPKPQPIPQGEGASPAVKPNESERPPEPPPEPQKVSFLQWLFEDEKHGQ